MNCVNCAKGIHRLCDPNCGCDCEPDPIWTKARIAAGQPVKLRGGATP